MVPLPDFVGRPMLKKKLVIATLCAAGLVLCANEAKAQCSGRDVLQNATTPKTAQVVANSAGFRGGTALPVWKTITLGEFANSFVLRNALDAADCGIGDLGNSCSPSIYFSLDQNRRRSGRRLGSRTWDRR